MHRPVLPQSNQAGQRKLHNCRHTTHLGIIYVVSLIRCAGRERVHALAVATPPLVIPGVPGGRSQSQAALSHDYRELIGRSLVPVREDGEALAMALVRIVALALTLAIDPKVAGGGCVFVPHVVSRATFRDTFPEN